MLCPGIHWFKLYLNIFKLLPSSDPTGRNLFLIFIYRAPRSCTNKNQAI